MCPARWVALAVAATMCLIGGCAKAAPPPRLAVVPATLTQHPLVGLWRFTLERTRSVPGQRAVLPAEGYLAFVPEPLTLEGEELALRAILTSPGTAPETLGWQPLPLDSVRLYQWNGLELRLGLANDTLGGVVILHCDLALDCYSIYGTILATRAEAPSRHAATQ